MKIKGLVVVLLLFVSLAYGYKYEEKVEKSFTLTPDARFKLSNINGVIQADTYSGEAVQIKAIKMTHKKADLEKVDILIDHQKESLTIRVKKDKKWRRLSFKVDFYLKIPARLKTVYLRSINGNVKTDGDYRHLSLITVNGRVEFKGEFAAGRFKSTNGRINIYQEGILKGDTSISAVNGALRLYLNEDSDFQVRASTVNGSIRSDFDVEVKRRFIGSKMVGSVKSGKHRLSMESVNGSIRLLKI
jgi:DUF4097 and DUF4098 domain-containing protein YvlB